MEGSPGIIRISQDSFRCNRSSTIWWHGTPFPTGASLCSPGAKASHIGSYDAGGTGSLDVEVIVYAGAAADMTLLTVSSGNGSVLVA
jgi:hypothetical protein